MNIPMVDLGALAPAMQRGRTWWSERSARERMLLAALAAIAVAALLLAGVLVPLQSLRADLLADIRNASLLEARLRTGGAGLALSGKARSGPGPAIITDSAAAAGLAIQRIEPDGADTRVALADAPFDRVLQWIAEVEQTSRLRTRHVRIESKGSPGIVSATVVFSG